MANTDFVIVILAAGKGTRLKSVLANNGMEAPPPNLTSQQQDELNKLRHERHFNGDYLDAQEKVHHDAIELFENYKNNGENESLRKFAARAKPSTMWERCVKRLVKE